MPLTRPRFSQFDTTISSISDPVTVLNKSATLANVDVGFVINRNGGALANTAIFWNESANTFVLAFTTNSGELPNANIAISTYANLQVGTLTATFVNTTGNIVSGGNVTAPYFFGNGALLTGIVSGGGSYSNVQVATYLPTYSGNIANIRLGVAGVLTFADGTTQITAGGGSYSNVQVASYLPTHSGTVGASLINSTGNILATGLSVFGNVVLGSLATPGALNTLQGNVSILGASSMLNVIGNIVVNNTAIASSNVTGAIRTTGGIGVGGNLYVGQRVGYVWGANNVSSVYQIFNNSTNSLDTVFG